LKPIPLPQNLIALIPLALLLGCVTEDLALRLGDIMGGLLNATFGNVSVSGGQEEGLGRQGRQSTTMRHRSQSRTEA
jgi:hypothetical protein